MSVPNLSFVLAGAVLPKIAYTDLSGNPQTLTFRMPPTSVDPISPVPNRADNVAGDGTMWSINLYVEAYVQMRVTALMGDDLTNWINFLSAAVNGQVLQLYPDSTKTSHYGVRLMVGGSSNANNSNVPSGDPTMKRAGVCRFQAQLVFRYENPSDAATVFAALNPIA